MGKKVAPTIVPDYGTIKTTVFPTTTVPTSSTYTCTSYTCSSCGVTFGAWELHVCPTPSVYDPFKTPKVSIKSVKHISWQEYKPAHPPAEGNDYLIVFIGCVNGNKATCRGGFTINPKSHVHEWRDEHGEVMLATVTHYVKLELP